MSPNSRRRSRARRRLPRRAAPHPRPRPRRQPDDGNARPARPPRTRRPVAGRPRSPRARRGRLLTVPRLGPDGRAPSARRRGSPVGIEEGPRCPATAVADAGARRSAPTVSDGAPPRGRRRRSTRRPARSEDARRRARQARVRGRDAERGPAAPGPRCCRSPALRPVVAAGRHDEHFERERPGYRPRASGPSANAAYGSTTPMSATRAASCASPSPFGSTAASSPARIWSVRPYTAAPPSASGCQPADPNRDHRRARCDPCRPSGPCSRR